MSAANFKMEPKITTHRFLPMALGSGSSSLLHKCRRICRKVFAEAQSLHATQHVLDRICCVCTDMGTDMSIPDTIGVTLEQVLPPWMLDDRLALDVDEPDTGTLPQDLRPYIMPLALVSPGILHICHNMLAEVDSKLSGWQAWLPGLQALTHLLPHDNLR